LVSEGLPQGLALRSRKKFGKASAKVRSVHDTLDDIIPLCGKIGVTRITNITFMDRLYIPNYSVVLPGTDDTFWVYGGKGITAEHAKASAIMEAIERYSSLSSKNRRCLIRGTYSQLSTTYNVLHPVEVIEPVNHEFNDRYSILDFLPGFDLLKNEEILVPTEIALYRHFPKQPSIPAFSNSHTNGLASGNVIEEAVCQALCEVIERDAVSIADLSSSSIPYNIMDGIIDTLKNDVYHVSHTKKQVEQKFVDDATIFPDVDISEIADDFIPINHLVKRFAEAGITLLIKNITQEDIGIPTFVASSIDWITQDYGFLAKGFGTHPDARIALMRAITEVSQTRAINIHGARDDLRRVQYKDGDEIHKRKWQFVPATSFANMFESYILKFSEINTHVSEDILDDINHILGRLRGAGLKRAIIVDLTNPSIGIPVVRAIVPGLETFEVQNSLMGKRAKEFYWSLHSPNKTRSVP
jgi:thioglycine synthase